jgi:hypothetical protein
MNNRSKRFIEYDKRKKNVHFVSSFLQAEIIRTKSFYSVFSFMILLLVIKKENNYDCYSSMINSKEKGRRFS